MEPVVNGLWPARSLGKDEGMREIHYASGKLVTSDEVAVMEYAADLANRNEAATLLVPALGLADGESRVELLVGPASQLMSQPIHDERVLPLDADFLTDLESRIAALTERPRFATEWDDF
jgi:hypothetical protein